MPNGYTGRVLRVDLSNRKISVDEPDGRFYREYLGGWGFIAHYLLSETPPDVDPLGPENPMVFANGVVSGIPLQGAGRNAVGARSCSICPIAFRTSRLLTART